MNTLYFLMLELNGQEEARKTSHGSKVKQAALQSMHDHT